MKYIFCILVIIFATSHTKIYGDSFNAILSEEENRYLKNTPLNIYYNNWEPFTVSNGKIAQGLAIDIIKEISNYSNLKYKFIKVERFSDSLQKVKNDAQGVIISTSSTKDREEYATFSTPYATFPLSIATNKKINNFNDLAGEMVAVGKDFTAYKLLKQYYPNIKLIPVKNTQEALALLSKGKVFGVSDIKPVLFYHINQNQNIGIKINNDKQIAFDLQIMVNSQSKEIIPILNKLIKNIDTTTKENIINKWIYSKESKKIDNTTNYIILSVFLIIICFLIYRQYLLKKYHKKLEDSEFRWKFAVDGTGDGLWDWDIETNEVYFSKQWKNMLGFEEYEIGNTLEEWKKRVNPTQIDEVTRKIIDHQKGLTPYYESEHQILCKDNTYKWILDRGIVVKKDENNQPLRMIGIHTEITKQRKLLEDIKLVKNQFENMFKTHNSIMLLIDPRNGNIINANLSASNFYGYSYDEFISMNINQINTQSKDKIKESINKAKNYSENTFYFPHKLKDGSIKTVEVQSSPIETEKGNILFSIIKDITKEKELENEIIKQRDFTSTIIDNSNAIIAVINSDGVMFKVNKYAQDFSGYTQKEIASKPYFWKKFLPEDKKEKCIEIIQEAKKGNIVKFFKNSWISKTGEERVFEWSNLLVKKENGQMDYLATIGIDITEKENTQKLILAQKTEFESIFKFSSDGIAITDLDTNFLEFNDAYLNITGFSKDELIKKSSLDLTVPELKEKMKFLIQKAIKKGNIQNFQKESIVANNRRISIDMSITLMPNQEKFLLIIKDITSMKILENQSRLASMGEMIGNIAHQWRQPLSVISTIASGIKLSIELDKDKDEESIKEATDKIIEQTFYLSKTIDDFRNFIKKDEEFKLVFVSNIIKETLSIIDSSIKNNYINVISQIKDDMQINGNKNELQQSLINILNNSIGFLKSNAISESNRYILIKTIQINSNSLELSILDSAGGIDEKIINKIFDPYFTTKHQSIGTGLGLSMADKILREKHKFDLSVHNEEFTIDDKKLRGACLKIILKK